MIKKRGCLYLTLFFTFLIGNYNGYIALWTGNSAKPDYVFPYSVASLPPADQTEVNNGIHITTRNELERLLEDYLS